MKAQSLINAVERLGGTAKIVESKSTGFGGKMYVTHHVEGILNGYDIHMHGLESSFFTTRAIKDRNYYDPGSDYNSGGYQFARKLKYLAEDCRLKITV